MTLRLLFAGTPDFAVPCLRAALEGGSVLAVLTQPDRPAGRGRQPQMSPVKQVALEHGISVLQPQSLREAEVQAQLAALAPDLLVVVAYGLILPQAVLDIPRHGCINIHASLLPRWRGAAPATYAHKLDKAEARLDWAQPAATLARRIRAFNPWPVAEVQLEGERLRIHRAVAVAGNGAPGAVLLAGREGLVVACSDGALRLDVVQRDGGRAISATDYLNARPGLRR